MPMEAKIDVSRIYFENGERYMELRYEYYDESGNHWLEVFPKVEFPFFTSRLPRIRTASEDAIYLEAKSTCKLYAASSKATQDRDIKEAREVFNILLEEHPKEMTIQEIETALGYKVKIVGDK